MSVGLTVKIIIDRYCRVRSSYQSTVAQRPGSWPVRAPHRRATERASTPSTPALRSARRESPWKSPTSRPTRACFVGDCDRQRPPGPRARVSSRASTSPASVKTTAFSAKRALWAASAEGVPRVGFGGSRCRRTALWPKGVSSADGGFRGAGGGRAARPQPEEGPEAVGAAVRLASRASSLPRTGGVVGYSASDLIMSATCRSP